MPYILKSNLFDLFHGNLDKDLGLLLRIETFRIMRFDGQDAQADAIQLHPDSLHLRTRALLEWLSCNPDKVAARVERRLKQIEDDYTIETDGKYSEMQRSDAKRRQELNFKRIEGLLMVWGLLATGRRAFTPQCTVKASA